MKLCDVYDEKCADGHICVRWLSIPLLLQQGPFRRPHFGHCLNTYCMFGLQTYHCHVFFVSVPYMSSFTLLMTWQRRDSLGFGKFFIVRNNVVIICMDMVTEHMYLENWIHF